MSLPDAEPVVSTITQIFKTLDEYSENLTRAVGNATDRGFCQKILDEAGKDAERKDILKPVKYATGGRKSAAGTGLGANEGFIINHYAGKVQYTTIGWLDKNNDRLLAECEALIGESKDPLVHSLA